MLVSGDSQLNILYEDTYPFCRRAISQIIISLNLIAL